MVLCCLFWCHYWPFQGGSFVVVLCCLFLVSEFRWRSPYVFISFLVWLDCWVATFWKTADHSVDPLSWPYVLFVLFWLFVILVISRFGFEGWIWVLIASVPDLCILFTFTWQDKDSNKCQCVRTSSAFYSKFLAHVCLIYQTVTASWSLPKAKFFLILGLRIFFQNIRVGGGKKIKIKLLKKFFLFNLKHTCIWIGEKK